MLKRKTVLEQNQSKGEINPSESTTETENSSSRGGGLQFLKGDVLVSIDAQPVKNLNPGQLNARIKSATTITVLRQGVTVTLTRTPK
jgi:hypothetical protein